MKSKNTRMTTKKAAATLAAIVIAPTVAGFLPVPTPLGIASAQAQPRFGTPEWDKNRESRRARDYRDSDLNRLSSITVRGTVTSNPSNDLFEFRAENNTSYRVLARSNVSLRDIRRNDRVQISGKRDGNILIAYSVTKLGNNNGGGGGWQDGQTRQIRGTVTSSLSNSRFSLRIDNRQTVTVSTRGSSVRNISRGDEVEVTGRWNRQSNVFNATSARVLRSNDDDFSNGRRVDFQGRITKAGKILNAWFFTVRTDRGRDVNVRFSREFRVGDRVRVEGTVQNNVVVASRINRN